MRIEAALAACPAADTGPQGRHACTTRERQPRRRHGRPRAKKPSAQQAQHSTQQAQHSTQQAQRSTAPGPPARPPVLMGVPVHIQRRSACSAMQARVCPTAMFLTCGRAGCGQGLGQWAGCSMHCGVCCGVRCSTSIDAYCCAALHACPTDAATGVGEPTLALLNGEYRKCPLPCDSHRAPTCSQGRSKQSMPQSQ